MVTFSRVGFFKFQFLAERSAHLTILFSDSDSILTNRGLNDEG